MESSETLAKLPQIIEAATRCFQDKGYVATTLNDIADAVQLQKPTLYHYLKNKNELLFLVLKNTAESYNQALEAVVASSLSPWDKMDRAIRQHIHLQLEHPGTVTLFRDVGELDKPYRREIRQALKRYRELLQEIIRQGIEAGQFRPSDASMAALFVLGAINFVHRWYRERGPRSIPEIAEFYSDTLLKSLSKS
ncbi:TetR/AcrR family transcriptional regulator [Sulfobacillus harzensis]|uniref:TetR/AcrR family transcriptional regulator n=1 Tax=Sulfobacillus harzensis TaxID=2729629 RepID=A0A7Y0Q2W1_9FIRM|nr:TetR/AcrR family transcriptional regulator [Sulfobacillus harzensis]NMP22775.1 TetR/AcrR family transcriptional regulator [Sulfobacillus harzensis]